MSVVVPTVGRDHLHQTLESLVGQDWPHEIIVVADDNYGAVNAMLRPYAESPIQLVCTAVRRSGPAAAKNLGYRCARGQFITWQDDDDQALPGKLRTLASFLLENPKYEAVYGTFKAHYPSQQPRPNCGGPHPRKHETTFEDLLKSNSIGSGSIMVRSPVLADLAFDEALRFGEDYKLWLEIAQRGPIAFVEQDVYVWNAGRPDSLGMNTPDWQQRTREIQDQFLAQYDEDCPVL